MVGIATAAVGVGTALAPYLPLIGKMVMGWLPPNAAAVVGNVVETVKAGIGLTQPILRTLDNIAGSDAAGKDISLAEMKAAIAELHVPGVYEEALKLAEAELARKAPDA